MLVPLTKFTDFPASKNLIFSGLEVRFDNQSAIVHQPILVDDIENLFVYVNQP
jgi:hypothetical protein